jgi:pyridoxine 5-phosphate synthase
VTAGPLRLGLNIDHVATIRNARGGVSPDPLRAAELALGAGADGITAHLREDRRHIADADIEALTALVARLDRPLNLEMALTDEMVEIAVRHRPHAVCLVPERREERTTEGGLDAVAGHNALVPAIRRLHETGGSRVSLFIEPSLDQVAASATVGAQVVELHTGAYCDALRAQAFDAADHHLRRLAAAAREAHRRGLEVHAGHGIDYDSVTPVAALPEVRELNIGHFLIGEAIFVGLDAAIGRMLALMRAARGEAAA